jgi:hypothetical protein
MQTSRIGGNRRGGQAEPGGRQIGVRKGEGISVGRRRVLSPHPASTDTVRSRSQGRLPCAVEIPVATRDHLGGSVPIAISVNTTCS